MENNIKVAVLMATYNGADWVEEQIESILSQRDVNINLVISDDISCDDTTSILEHAVNNDGRVSLLKTSPPPNGAGKNFYRLIRYANIGDAEYIALADQDDVWLKNKLSRQVDSLHLHSADAISGNVVAFWRDGQLALINKAQPLKSLDYLFESAGPGCTFCLSRRLFLEIRNFLLRNDDQRLPDLHDWFIYAYARAHGYKWHIDQRPLLKYRQHDHNVIGVNKGIRASLNRLSKVKKSWYRKQVGLILYSIHSKAVNTHKILERVERLSFIDRFVLAFNTHQFRRKKVEQLMLSIMFITYLY